MTLRTAMPAAALAALGLALSACAAKRPVLYPNAGYRSAGVGGAEADVADCMALAEAAVGDGSAAAATARSSATGAGVGAAAGAVGGAIAGRAGTGAAIGAGVGGTRGLFRGLFRSRDRDPIFRAYVERCLADRGYDTLGWR